jgi:hypothetical protein
VGFVIHAQEVIENWRIEFNEVQPHSSPGGKTPYEFVKEHQSMRQEQKLNLIWYIFRGKVIPPLFYFSFLN